VASTRQPGGRAWLGKWIRLPKVANYLRFCPQNWARRIAWTTPGSAVHQQLPGTRRDQIVMFSGNRYRPLKAGLQVVRGQSLASARTLRALRAPAQHRLQ
jgi:hypothetical protein